jgi:glycosyltransferase involved in cell wall biosynthesis
MRITHVITGLEADGAETMLYSLVCGMDRGRFSNEVISLRDIGVIGRRLLAAGIPVRAAGFPNPLGFVRLARWLRDWQPRLVHTWMYHADLIGGLAAGNTPVMWSIHHGDPGTARLASVCARLSRRIPSQIICCSKSAMRAHVAAGYDKSRMVFIPNGIDLDAFRPDNGARNAVCHELGIDPTSLLIGLAARRHPDKGHSIFLNAAQMLLREDPTVHFVLCGRGVEELQTGSDRIHRMGARNDMRRFFAALDVATSASIGEAFLLSVAEAMACGTPCVVTDAGDSGEIVGDTGVVVPLGNAHALADGWRSLIALGKDARHTLGIVARGRIRERFSLAQTITRYEHLYDTYAQTN